jgi:hypothetical protein
MKYEYQNIIKFDENYYRLPREFAEEIANLLNITNYNLMYVPQASRTNGYDDLYSIITQEGYLAEQFIREFNLDGTMVLETLPDTSARLNKQGGKNHV